MRLSEQIERDVVEELSNDASVAVATVQAQVTGGVVRLTGSAPTYAAKLATLRAAERVAGVRTIVDEMVVVPPPHLSRSDLELLRGANTALALNTLVPRRGVRVAVDDGLVTLDGTVASHAERCAAESTIAVLAGVRGILNRLRVEPDATPTLSIIPGIERAFHRSAELDCKHILIEAAPDGEVLLRGTVRSWAEVHDAERAAWSAPGVRSVLNRLAVVL